MTLSLTVLGSSGTYAGVDGACTGFLVRSDEATVMMDAGPGTLANLQRHAAIADLDAVVLSHSHPDHWLELPVLRNALRYVLMIDGLALYATAETLELADQLTGSGMSPTFRDHTITDGSSFRVGDQLWTCSRTDHPVETLGFRVDCRERSFAYTADTGPGWSVAQLCPPRLGPVDMVLSEATFLHGPEERPLGHAAGSHSKPVHLTAREAGEMARAAGAGRLVLTHILPGASAEAAAAEAAAAYGAPVDVAVPHLSLDVHQPI